MNLFVYVGLGDSTEDALLHRQSAHSHGPDRLHDRRRLSVAHRGGWEDHPHYLTHAVHRGVPAAGVQDSPTRRDHALDIQIFALHLHHESHIRLHDCHHNQPQLQVHLLIKALQLSAVQNIVHRWIKIAEWIIFWKNKMKIDWKNGRKI